MSLETDIDPAPHLHRALGTFHLVLLNVAAIVGFRWLSLAAQIGPSSLTLWALGLITFLAPAALTVLELGSRLPGEGGLYLWSKAAFGDVHAFIGSCLPGDRTLVPCPRHPSGAPRPALRERRPQGRLS